MSEFVFEKGIYHRGAIWRLVFDIKDSEGQPIDVSAYTLRFVGRQPWYDDTLIVNTVPEIASGQSNRVVVDVLPSQTTLATPGNMVCALWREDAPPNLYPLETGTIFVTEVAQLP